jgi:glycerol-3-phosphate O-acyltransferase/dihydroxyacetone phosphate acyltransferase
MNNFVYDILLWSFGVLVDLFFREVHPRSSWRVPRKGPVLFVAAPHANQVCCEWETEALDLDQGRAD